MNIYCLWIISKFVRIISEVQKPNKYSFPKSCSRWSDAFLFIYLFLMLGADITKAKLFFI